MIEFTFERPHCFYWVFCLLAWLILCLEHHNTFSMLWLFVVYVSILKYLVHHPNIFQMIQTSNPRMWKSEKSSVFVFIFHFCAMCSWGVCCLFLFLDFSFHNIRISQILVRCCAMWWQRKAMENHYSSWSVSKRSVHYPLPLYTLYLHHSQFTLRNFIFFFFLAAVRLSACLFVCSLVGFFSSNSICDSRTHPKWGYRK